MIYRVGSQNMYKQDKQTPVMRPAVSARPEVAGGLDSSARGDV